MSNTSYLAETRTGTRSAAGSVRLSVTLKDEVFVALRARAAASAHTVAGEAADIIATALSPSPAGFDKRRAEG